MAEKSTIFTKGSVTKNQKPVSQPEKKNSTRSNSSSIHRILDLQKAAGNKAVQGLIRTYLLQTKLKIGKPNDKYEQEADRIAEKVTTMPMPDVDQIAWQEAQEGEKIAAKKPFSQANPFLFKKHEVDEEETQSMFMPHSKSEEEEIETLPLIQREEMEEEEEMEEKVQAKLFIRRQEEEEEEEEVQTKSLIQLQQEETEEEEEEEEEEVQTKSLIQLQQEESEEEEEEEVQTKSLIQPQQEESEEEEEEEVQAKELPGHTPEISPNIEMDINNIRGGGQPLSFGAREFFEPRFGYDFSRVKVHTDSRAANASESIHARAFSIGHDIFFGEGQYKPEKTAGRHLIAHELTHVVQQGGGRVLNRSEIVSRWYSHLNKSERSLVQKENNKKGGGQSERLHRKLAPLNIDRVNDSKVVQGGFWDRVVKMGSAAVKGVKKLGSKIKKGITAVAGNLIKKAKEYIADKVKNVPGYELATYILGKDPITQKKVSKKSGGFLKLIFRLLGAEETYDRLVESKVVKKAYSLLSNAFRRAKLTWGFIVKSIKGIWAFLTKNPLGLIKALGMAKNFFFSLVSKTIQVGKNVLTKIPLLILEGFLILVGAPVKRIMGIINKGKEVILLIANNPMKFVGRLVGALKKGFFQFKDNIWKHLKAGLLSWLFGTLQKAGITMPEKFDLKGIFSLVMQILGITYALIREKVVKVIGEKNMQRLEKAWEFLKALVTGGIGALWEKIKESLDSLKDMVIGAIKNWVVTKIVISAISKLASMFNPVGAIIQAALTIYNTIMFFIERAKQIAALVEAIFNSIADIAYGKITAAANWIEKTMARSIPVILGFLARFLNLSGIDKAIKKVIMKIRKPIDKVVNKTLDFIMKKAKNLFRRGKAGIEKRKDIGDEKSLHRQLAKEAISELKKNPEKSKDYDTILREKKAQATKIQNKYTKRLKRGIRLSFKFKEPSEDKGDNDIDFEVIISPNTFRVSSSIPVGSVDEWPDGGRSDPIPIKWYKPKSIYPTIGGKNPTQGVLLPKTSRKPARSLKVSDTNFLTVNAVISRREVGRPPEPKKEDIRRRLVLERDKGGLKVSHSDFAIDHVRDLSWKGRDVYTNLWPLDRKMNNAVNASHNQYARVRVKNKVETHSVKRWGAGKFFYIAKVVNPPSTSGGHGTSHKKPVNDGTGGVPKRK